MSHPGAAVIAPGYAGSADQPIVKKMAAALTARGLGALPVTFSTSGKRPSKGYLAEQDDLREARTTLAKDHAKVALVGRSFGGRMCSFLAAQETPAALVVLGHPVSPANRPRPDDEAALAAVKCPILVVQGDHDALGPLEVLERIAKENPNLEIHVIDNCGHNFGRREQEAVEFAADWLARVLH
jgi:predicted alpha/beta-hydrolase family hydrolase